MDLIRILQNINSLPEYLSGVVELSYLESSYFAQWSWVTFPRSV